MLHDLIPTEFPSVSDFNKLKVLVQGIEIPSNAPINWLADNFSHPDGFLYFVIVHL